MPISKDDSILFTHSEAEKYIVDLGVPKPQKRLFSIFFKEAGSSYPGYFVLKYSEEVTLDIFQKCKLTYYSNHFYETLHSKDNEADETLKVNSKEEAEKIWQTAMLSVSNYFEIHKTHIPQNSHN